LRELDQCGIDSEGPAVSSNLDRRFALLQHHLSAVPAVRLDFDGPEAGSTATAISPVRKRGLNSLFARRAGIAALERMRGDFLRILNRRGGFRGHTCDASCPAIGNRERGFLMPDPPSSCCASGRSLACSTSWVIRGRRPRWSTRPSGTSWTDRVEPEMSMVLRPTNGATRSPGLEPHRQRRISASRNSPHRHRPHHSHSGCPHRCGVGLTAVGPPLSGRCDAGGVTP
jgi:hypothetical protein